MRKTIVITVEVETSTRSDQRLRDAIVSCLSGQDHNMSWDGGPNDGKTCDFSIIAVRDDMGNAIDTDLARMEMAPEMKRAILNARPAH